MSSGNGHAEPDVMQAELPGPLVIQYPITMFLPSGALEHRIHRSRFMTQAAKWYDDMAEQCRKKLIERNPQLIMPPLEKLGLTVIDVSAVTKAAQPEEEEITPGAV